MTSSKVYQAKVTEDPQTKEFILNFDEKMIEEIDWREGDKLQFSTEDEGVIITNTSWLKRNKKKPGSMKGKN